MPPLARAISGRLRHRGIVGAPIYYANVKADLMERGLV